MINVIQFTDVVLLDTDVIFSHVIMVLVVSNCVPGVER